jgi:hypothetical protein
MASASWVATSLSWSRTMRNGNERLFAARAQQRARRDVFAMTRRTSAFDPVDGSSTGARTSWHFFPEAAARAWWGSRLARLIAPLVARAAVAGAKAEGADITCADVANLHHANRFIQRVA